MLARLRQLSCYLSGSFSMPKAPRAVARAAASQLGSAQNADAVLPAKPKFAPLVATSSEGYKIEFRRVRALPCSVGSATLKNNLA